MVDNIENYKKDSIDEEVKKYEFIARLKEMKDNGIISEEEFEKKKNELL